MVIMIATYEINDFIADIPSEYIESAEHRSLRVLSLHVTIPDVSLKINHKNTTYFFQVYSEQSMMYLYCEDSIVEEFENDPHDPNSRAALLAKQKRELEEELRKKGSYDELSSNSSQGNENENETNIVYSNVDHETRQKHMRMNTIKDVEIDFENDIDSHQYYDDEDNIVDNMDIAGVYTPRGPEDSSTNYGDTMVLSNNNSNLNLASIANNMNINVNENAIPIAFKCIRRMKLPDSDANVNGNRNHLQLLTYQKILSILEPNGGYVMSTENITKNMPCFELSSSKQIVPTS